MPSFKALALAGAISAGAIASSPATSCADETAREANALAALDVLDLVATRATLARPYTWENNPVARPFVRSNASAVAYFATSALVANGIAHLLHRRSADLSRAFLAGEASLEVYSIANTVRH